MQNLCSTWQLSQTFYNHGLYENENVRVFNRGN